MNHYKKTYEISGLNSNKMESITFSLSALGQNILFGLISSALAYYYQSVIFLPTLAIGILNALIQIINIFKEPFMGIIIDKTDTKYGKCRPYLIIMPLIIGIATIAVFINGIYSDNNTASQNAVILTIAVITNIIWNILYTAGDVPLTTLPSVLTDDSSRKSRLISYAMVAATLGMGAVSLFFIPFAQSLGAKFNSTVGEKSNQYGFIVAVILFTVIGAILYQLAGLFTRERVKRIKSNKTSLKSSLKTIRSCRPYRLIFTAGILRAPADTVMTTLTLIIIYYFGNNGNKPYLLYMVVFLISLGIGQVSATLTAPILGRKIEKRTIFLISTAILIIATSSIFIMYLVIPLKMNATLPVILLAVMLFICGIASGTLNVTQSNMIADTVDLAEYETGSRPDGVFFSGLTMLNKISVGVTALITGIIFAAVGFSGDNVKNVNELLNVGADFATDPVFASYRLALFSTMCIPPVIGFALSAIPIFKYNLSNSKHSLIVEELKERNESKKTN